MSVTEIAVETGKYIWSEGQKNKKVSIVAKGENNFVTEVDKAAEEMIVKNLARVLPEAGFIAEEGTSTKKGEKYNWVIDPLDGTTNFIHGLPPFAVSIALMDGDEVVLGVIYEMALKECFYAWKNGKAYLNGEVIHVSNVKKVDGSLIATGFPYTNFKYLDPFMDSLYYFMKNSHGLRRLGSAATDIAYIACGRFEGFYEYGLHPWDVAAGAIILKEAGGEVCDFRGGEDYIFGEEIIASNSAIFTEFRELINRIMLKKG